MTLRWLDTRVAEPKDYLLVRNINTEADVLHEAFAITEERRAELAVICEDAMRETGDSAASAAIISQKMLHANELFYCAYAMCSAIETRKRTQGFLGSLLSGMGRPPQEGK